MASSIDDPAAARMVDPLQDPDWDQKLLAHPDHSFFHGAAWARVLRDAYGYTPRYFVTGDEPRLDSLLPVMEVESWLTGKRAVALPFTDQCPGLGSDGKALFQQALLVGGRRGWRSLECRGITEMPAGGHPSLSFYGHSLDLRRSEQELFANCDASVCRAVRKAEREGVSLQIDHSLQALRVFYSLHCRTRRKHGLPPQPFSFFEKIHEHVLARELGFVAVAYSEDRPVAGAVFFHLGKRAVFKFGASDERSQHLRGSNFVMWEAIRRLAGEGFESLDFGRTSLANLGLRRFKLGWGASERRIDYLKYDFARNGFVTGRDRSNGLYNHLFRILPVLLGRLVGKLIYRHVA